VALSAASLPRYLFTGRAFQVLLHLPNFARLYWRLFRDRRVPILPKALLVLTLVYVVSPLDLVPDFVPVMKPEPFDQDWKGGFYCPCHKSRYDMSGRVYAGVPAPKNLLVPPYHFVDDTHIQIGVDPKEAG